ncbi:MAG: T9SS type A sorting domain-containing protein [Flavobacteriales bacterium]|nr:T9SS type A sorting domain-containing protein [Flavobacteriales bacterium]
MKNSNTIFGTMLLAVLLSGSISAQLTINTPEIVAAQDPWGNVRPRLALDSDNNPIVIWTHTDSMAVFLSKYDGTIFSSPMRINPLDIHAITYDWGGPDVASIGSKVYVLYQSHGDAMYGPVYLHNSTDNGDSWSDTLRVDSPALNENSWLPALGIGQEGGGPIVAYMKMQNEAGHEWYMTRSTDGNSFTEEMIVSGGANGPVCDCCPATITTTPYLEAIVFRNNDDNLRDIHAAYNYSALESGPIPVDVDTVEWVIGACPASGPSAFWQGGNLITTWRTLYDGHVRIFTSSYDIQNDELTTKQLYPQEGSMQQNYPIVAGMGNIMAVVWEQTTSGQRDIYFTYSTTGFDELGTEIINLTENMDGNQLRPHMVYDGYKFHIVFTDNGGDAVQYLTVDLPLGVNENELSEMEISLAPNPSSTLLEIQIAEARDGRKYTVEVTDANGKLLRKASFNHNGSLQVDVRDLPNGVYHLSISEGGIALTAKQFVVQH